MIKAAFAFIHNSPYKTGVIILAVLSIICVIYTYGHSAGYNKAKAQELKAVEAAVEATKKEFNALMDRNTKEKNDALELVKKLQNLPEVTPNEVNKAAAASKCKHLGVEFNRMFNRAVGEPPN